MQIFPQTSRKFSAKPTMWYNGMQLEKSKEKAGEEAREERAMALERRRLGRTGLELSRLCFGTLTLSPLQRNLPPKEGAALLRHAFDRGVNCLDTAELYDNYPAIALALKGWQGQEIVVSTKCYAYDGKTAAASLEKARRGLNRDVIDIFMLHEQESAHTLRGHGEALDYFAAQQAKGRIRALGISTHHVAAARAAAEHPLMQALHPIYNRRGLGVADGSREDMEEAVAWCAAAGLGILGMKPLGGGHLIGDRAAALDYALAAPLDAIALGMQSEAEIDYNVAYFSGEDATPYEAAVNSRPRQLIVQDWCIACGRCVERCQQRALTIANGRAQVKQNRCIRCGYCASVCPEFCLKII